MMLNACGNAQSTSKKEPIPEAGKLSPITAAQQIGDWISILKQKNIGVVGNQTSILFDTLQTKKHLVDTLLLHDVSIKKVFAPEHGFRGKADAGEYIKDGVDLKTGLPIISLYGKNKKPFPEQLQGIEMIVFDIQDVGARFYTYISTLHYVMEACAENDIAILVLDRPNPNAHYIDGPVLNLEFKSFVGMHPVPIVYGMTMGEYAQMINGEKWLKNGVQCNLKVIPLKNYDHQTPYSLPVKPSPNLPNDVSINLYPSLCFFEGTARVSAGRGTQMQFQIYGQPNVKDNFCFTPTPNEGAKYPKNKNLNCCGEDLRNHKRLSALNLKWLIKAYSKTIHKDNFFNTFFDKLAGTDVLRMQIEAGIDLQEIKHSWEKDLIEFRKMRTKYLLYQN